MAGKVLRCLLSALFSHVVLVSANAGGTGASGAQEDLQLPKPQTAIGKLVNETGAWCSGVVISKDTVLTAAHCLYNRRTERYIAAEALHFLVGYHLGRYSAHLRIETYQLGSGFDPRQYANTVDADWAVLKLAEPLPSTVIPIKLNDAVLPVGSKSIVVGYSQSHPYAQTVHSDCSLQDDIVAGKLMFTSCEAQKGLSGAPILVEVDGEVRIAGIQVAALRTADVTGTLAIPAETFDRIPSASRSHSSPQISDNLQGVCVLDRNTIRQFYFEHRAIVGISLNSIQETKAELPAVR